MMALGSTLVIGCWLHHPLVVGRLMPTPVRARPSSSAFDTPAVGAGDA
jgi:hypothetical protein